MVSGTLNNSVLKAVAMSSDKPRPSRQPTGRAITINSATSPNRMYDVSPRENPNTRRVANSRPRSDSAMRVLL